MPVVRINAEKDARCTQSVVQLQGDTRTTMVRFIVNRYDGGVDLAGLVWLIKTTNAAGVPDAWEPEMVENAGEKIVIDWLIQGNVNDADGLTEYELNGLGYEADGKAIKWVGGKGTVSVRKSYHPTFGDDTDGFSNLEKLIIYVNGELQDTVAAVERAEAAATAAAEAAADSIWTSKPQGLSFGQQLQAQENIGLLEVVKNLTEPVEAEGNPVEVELVGGMPFDSVKTLLEPKQAGSGEPSPENIRPVIAWEQARLQNSNGEITQGYIAAFDQAVYGGAFNWKTGVFTAKWECRTFDGTERWVTAGTTSPYFYMDLGELGYAVDGLDNQFASHYPIKTITSSNTNTDCMYVYNSTSLSLCRLNVRVSREDITDLASWKAWLAAQHAAGTPVQICFKLGAPLEIKFESHQVRQLRGTNELSGDGVIAVVGRKQKTVDLQESDPTVPAWAKTAEKPKYTAEEVGAASKEEVEKLADEVDGLKNSSSGGGGVVWSVNGKTGEVILSAADVGALPEDTQIPDVSDFITRAVSDLLNYYTKSQTYTRDEIDQKVSAIPKFAISVVSALPSAGISATTIYLVPSGADDNLYTEYINVNGTWEILGSQRVDLTGYATQSWALEQLKGYQPKGNYALKSELPAVPTNVSAFTNDAGYAKKSELPAKLSDLSEDSTHRVVTDAEKAAWNGKSNFSGNYADLNGKPTIPVVPTNVSVFKNDAGYVTEADLKSKGFLPEYVEEEIKDTANKLYAKAALGNVSIIGFSTDQHVSKWTDQHETTNTPGTIFGLKALRKIADMFPFNAVVFGGDYSNGSASSINEGVYMVYAPLTGAACPVMGTAGNHDSWQDQQDVTNAQIFKRHAARAKVDYPAFAPLDKISANGYYDDPTVNIRYIILDAEPRNTSVSTNSTATITANLTAMLAGVPEGYKAIIFSHKPLNSALGSGFKDAVNNATVLETNAEKIICCINGHGHTDASETLNGVLYIQTRAAAPTNYMGVADLSSAGTADETAFDVFVIDQENGKICAVRYGAGADREFDIPVPNTKPINEIPISTDTDGSIYNGIGYKTGCRINSSGVLKENESSYTLTGFIPYKAGDIASISPDVFAGNAGSCSISGFKSDKSFATNASIYSNNSYGALVTESDGSYTLDVNRLTTGRAHWNNVEFIRVSGAASTMSAASVITVKRAE